MKVNWDMPASAMTAEEFLLVVTIQGLCAALSYGSGHLVPGGEIVEDALHVVEKAKELTNA